MSLFRRSRREETWQLTRMPVVLSMERRPRRRRPLGLLLVLLLLMAAALWGRQYDAGHLDAALQWLRAQLPGEQVADDGDAAGEHLARIEALQAQVQRLQLQNDIAQATQAQLEQQNAALQEELRAARLELDFVKQHQPAASAPARRP